MSTPLTPHRYLHIEDLYKSYGARVVLDNVDLSVARGELCCVVGPSGCGKSTLLRQILGEERPDRGVMTLDGHDVGYPDTRRGIVFQRYSLYPHLRVIDNILLGPRMRAGLVDRRRRETEWREQAMHYLTRMRLADAAQKFPHELSGGMQQRVSIAQSMIMKPAVLMMDEPFGALDPDTREQMQLLLLELWEAEHTTVFFVTHDLEEAVFLGTRVVVLSQYYTDDRGECSTRGAKIVGDYRLPRAANATDVKRSPEFTRLVDEIRELGFNPQTLRHVRDFNLRHPDSFRTLTPEELHDAAVTGATPMPVAT